MKLRIKMYKLTSVYTIFILTFITTCLVLFVREFNVEENTKLAVLTEPLKDTLKNHLKVVHGTNYNLGVYDVSRVKNESQQLVAGRAVVQIDANILRMIEDIERSDTNMNKKIIFEGLSNFSCPETLRVVNGVEDLLCMKAPTFLKKYKNPCWYDAAEKLQCLPYFQVIGMDKCGSTDLFDRIAGHPDVVKNKGALQKETMWWSWKRYGHWLRYRIKIEPFQKYFQYFSPAATKIQSEPTSALVTGDGTPMDMWDMSGWVNIPQNQGLQEPNVITPHLIRHMNPAVKLIVILRDPLERVFSDYFFLKIGKLTTEAFHEEVVNAIKILHECTRKATLRKCLFDRHLHIKSKARLHLGFYSVFLRDWLKVFPRDQFLVLRTEDYSKNVSSHLTQIFKFLGLRNVSSERMGTIAKATRKYVTKKKAKTMLEKTKIIISRLYQSFNEELSNMLQDDNFSWKHSKL